MSRHWRVPYLCAFYSPAIKAASRTAEEKAPLDVGFSCTEYVFIVNLATLSVAHACMSSGDRIISDWLIGKDVRSGRSQI